jgi:hypothetical protein
MKEVIVSKKDFIEALVKSHLEMLDYRNQHNKKILKIITVLLIILLIALLAIILILSKMIGTTATQIVFGVLCLFCLGIILIRNDLKDLLLYSEKDLQVFSDYQKELKALEMSSTFGATLPDPSSVLKARNISLSDSFIEFQSFVNLLNKYLPSDINRDDIETFKTYGIHLSDNATLFGEKEGYRIQFL